MEQTPITISAEDLLAGMADSKFLGVQEIRNLDVFSDDGIIKLAYKAEVESGAPSADFIEHFAIDETTGNIYMGDNSGNVYKRTTGASWSNPSGNTVAQCRGLAIYKDYLFFIYNSGGNTKADRYGPLSGSPSWTTNWGTLATGYSSTYCPKKVGQDDILYIGVGNNVVSINSSFTINTSALDLPTGYVIQSLEEQGQYLQIGAIKGNSISSIGDIFQWDRVSPSFNLPLQTGLSGVSALKNENNVMFAMSGTRGDIIKTNSVQVASVKKLSKLTSEPDTNFNITNMCVDNWDGGILWGIGKTAGLNNGPCGLFYIKNGAWYLFTLSPGDGADNDGIEIGCVVALGNDKWLATWKDPTGTDTFGVDVLNTSRRTSSYGGYFTSKMYVVGTRLKQRIFQSGEFQLAKALTSSQGVKISYRLKSNDSWTEIDTFAYGDGSGSDRDNLGGITSFQFTPNIPPSETVQFKIALTTNTSNTETPELVHIIFK